MVNKSIFTPAQWLDRANDARKLAGALPDVAARETMLDIAARYEKLARYAALAAASEPDEGQRH